MANILACIELERGEATAASLSILNEARSIASGCGATLSALVPCVSPPSYGNDDIIAVLSRHGADKVILATHPDLGQAPLHFTHSRAIQAACDRLHPRLVLFPATPGGHDIAPRLAIQLRAIYLANVQLERTEEGFDLVCHGFGRSLRYATSLQLSHGLTLVTLISWQPPQITGDEEAEVMVVHVPSPEDSAALEIVDSQAVKQPDLVSAQVVICAGASLKTPQACATLEELASALNGAAAATSAACAAELAGGGLPLGLDGRCTNAPLCIMVEEPGGLQPLAGVSPSTFLLAITPDDHAPILRAAQLAIIDQGEKVVARWLDQLAQPAAAKKGGGR